MDLVRPDLVGTVYLTSSIRPPKTSKSKTSGAAMLSIHDPGLRFFTVCRVWILLFYSFLEAGARGRRSGPLVVPGLARGFP